MEACSNNNTQKDTLQSASFWDHAPMSCQHPFSALFRKDSRRKECGLRTAIIPRDTFFRGRPHSTLPRRSFGVDIRDSLQATTSGRLDILLLDVFSPELEQVEAWPCKCPPREQFSGSIGRFAQCWATFFLPIVFGLALMITVAGCCSRLFPMIWFPLQEIDLIRRC